MRKILILMVCTFWAYHAYSQQHNYVDARLYAVYTAEQIAEMQQSDPQHIEYLNWYLDNSYQILEVPPDKADLMPYLMQIDPHTKALSVANDIDEDNFNILLYECPRHYTHAETYRINNSGKAIAVFSQKRLSEMYNNHKSMKNE